MDYPLLPQDIFDTIIDNVWPDTDTLKNSALVSSAWLPSARSNLFYCIHLDPPTDNQREQKKNPCERLLTILKSSPTPSSSIGKYVREIYLSDGMDRPEWWAYEPTLPLLLRSLHNLRRFGIQANGIYHDIVWDRLPATLKTAIQDHVLCLPSLTELKFGNLTLNNISVMKNLLRSCRELRVLELNRIWVEDEGVAHLEMDSMDEVVSERRLQLNVLAIRPDTSIAFVALLLHPSSRISVEKVRKLVLSISSTTFADCARLLHASLFVEQLELTFMRGIDLEEYWKLPSQHQFNLSLIPHLQTLKVHIGVVLRKVDEALHWLKALLDSGSSSSRPNAVVKIWIVYTIYLSTSYRALKPIVLDKWVDIDALLCGNDTGKDSESGGSHAYERLKEVKLEFLLENLNGFAPKFLEQLVLDSPGLERRGILSINAFDSDDSFHNLYNE